MRTNRATIMLLGAASLSVVLVACSPKSAVRGNLPRPHQMEQIEVGKVNKSQVAQILGTPSVLGTFDANTWYYMSRRTEQWAFFEPDVVEQRILALYFDEGGTLEYFAEYTGDDAREIAFNNDVTPTAGRKLGFFEQIFGNFGRGGFGG